MPAHSSVSALLQWSRKCWFATERMYLSFYANACIGVAASAADHAQRVAATAEGPHVINSHTASISKPQPEACSSQNQSGFGTQPCWPCMMYVHGQSCNACRAAEQPMPNPARRPSHLCVCAARCTMGVCTLIGRATGACLKECTCKSRGGFSQLAP